MILTAGVLLTVLAGCGPQVRSGGAGVDHVTLWAAPLAEDVDGRPGTDGVSVRLIFYDVAPGGQTEAVAVQRPVDLAMYEGDVQSRALADAEPFHVWQVTAGQLAALGSSYYGLRCYAMTLYWPGRHPATGTVTLVARYENKGGRPLQSAPSVIKID
jgi:hypothetical protein